MSTLAVATRRLTKRYPGGVLAVEDLELRVTSGEVYAFLGLNGAGKSTTIRMLLGLISPTEGEAELFGVRVAPGASGLWRRVGSLVETATAYPDLTVTENLEIARRLCGVADAGAVGRVVELLALGPYRDRRAGTLSLGNLQRLALARALLHRPDLVILDEPANALDPAGVIEIRDLLRSLAIEDGVTVFMSSHILAEVDQLATRVGIVHRGRLIEELGSDDLRRHRDPRLVVGVRDQRRAVAALVASGYEPVLLDPEEASPAIELRDARAIAAPDEVARTLVEAGAPPVHLALARESLEEHFMRITSAADTVAP